MTEPRRMIINLDIRASQFNAFWRLPETDVDALYDFETYRSLAQRAEARAIHALFDADSLGIDPADAAYTPSRIFEPTSYFGALAASTSRIGLIGTYSTTFNEPFNLARKLAALDHLSKGRVGFNLVTSALNAAALNFGLAELPEHDERYERAAEFVDVIRALWTSFDADAMVADKESGVFTDPAKVHYIDHVGRHFSVRGPLTTFRPPQGWPVLSQAGESEAGKALAAKYAELVYTNAHSKETAKAYRDELRARAEQEGRDPDSIKLVQALHGAMADTRAEVEDYMATITALTPAKDELRRWERMTGWNLSALSESDPLPELPDPRSTNNYQTQLIRLRQQVESDDIRTVGDLVASTRRRKTGSLVVGSVDEVADHLQEWVEFGAVDGFVVGHGDQTQYGVDAVIDKLVPELQRRGAFRTEYEGRTLRENYGLPAVP